MRSNLRSRRGHVPARVKPALFVAIIFAAALALAGHFGQLIPRAEAVSTTVVISQVYGGGGNTGSTFRNDFIELFNRGTTAQSLNGWSVQYASTTGTSWTATNLTNVTLQPGQYYLVQQAQGTGGTTNLPTPDATGTIAMSATAGKVALVSSTTVLSGACPTTNVVDFVGFGTGTNCFEGTGPTTPPSNTTAVIRAGNGCTDTDQNPTDFSAVAPTPRNTATALAPCGGGGGTPNLSINDVSQDEGNSGTTPFTFTVSLSGPAGAGGVSFTVNTADGTATAPSDYTAIVNGSGSISQGNSSTTVTVNVNGDTTSEPNETFFVNITNVTGANVTDGQGQGTIVNDDVAIVPIFEIQGSGNASPRAGETVTTTGIVTGRKNNGYIIQDPSGDGNTETSDAIFVFTSSAPSAAINVGDSVRVTGTVTEFEPSTTEEPDGVTPSPDPKTATELTSPTTTVLSSGNTLPTALDADSLNIFNPAALSRGAELEKYEFMRVSVPSITVGQPTNGFGEFWGVRTGVARPFREPGIERGDPVPPADEGPHAGTPPPNVPIWDGNFERIMVDSDDATNTSNTRRASVFVTTGAVVTGVVGPLDFVHVNGTGNYRIMLDFTATPGVTPGLTAAVPLPTPTAQEFTVGHANLENFSSSNATKLSKASLAVRNVLRTPDVLGLIEVDTEASATALANRINSDFGDTSQVNYVAFFNDIAGSTQDIGYLVNTARVTVNGSATPYNQGATFTYCGVVGTLHDRPSLILSVNAPQAGGTGTFPVTVILNHNRSLIGIDSPASFGTCGTGTQGARNREKRRLQAEDIADLIQSRSGENLVVLGDLNAFDFNDGFVDVVGTLKGTPAPPNQVVEPSTDRWPYQLTNLLTKLSPSEQYSLLFEGSAQALDHILVNGPMFARNTRFGYARYNADFSADYATDANRPERVADHDSPVAYFTGSPAQPAGTLVISEFRVRGPGGVQDEFIEIYNNTDSPHTVQATDGSAGYAVVASNRATDPLFLIPNGTVIPARGHYLGCNPGNPNAGSTGYTLGAYAACDAQFPGDLTGSEGIALFSVFAFANPSVYSTATRFDAVGYASAPELYREGAGFQTAVPGAEVGNNNIEYSFLRDQISGTPRDTNDNAADFLAVVTTPGVATSIRTSLGAPGPENLTSPIQRNATIKSFLIDPNCTGIGTATASETPGNSPDGTPVSGCQNTARDFNSLSATEPNTSAQGTFYIRRRFRNGTMQNVTRLRFRVVDVMAGPANAGTADLRLLSAGDVTYTVNSSQVTVRGLKLDTPPAQPFGGGFNTTVAVGTITTQQPLAPGATVDVQFRFGVMQPGFYRFFVNVEAELMPVPMMTAPSKAGAPKGKH